jgi:GTP-dependent phosphoenolpyruvate carboxykinase
MEKINTFFRKHGSKVITLLLILLYLKSCGVDSELNRLKKEARANTELINTLPTANDLRIEGLNSEKRMIQATDRKMLDVQRQTSIEEEIKILENK